MWNSVLEKFRLCPLNHLYFMLFSSILFTTTIMQQLPTRFWKCFVNRKAIQSSVISRLFSTSSLDTLVKEPIFTQEHVELRRSLNKIIENDINPYVDDWEEAQRFPAHEVFKKLGNAGFLGVNKPVKYGGMGLDFTFTIAVAEELGNINCGGIPMAIGVQSDMCTPALSNFGSHELKKEFLAPSLAGDVVGCLGVSEAGSGSDVASIKTTAVKKGGDYIINGGKMWTTNGLQADWMCLLANTSEGAPHENKSLMVLPLKNTPGVTVAREIKKLGMHCSDTAQFYFEDVRIPQQYRIGEEGMGFKYQMLQFVDERLVGSAIILLTLEKIIHETAEYCKQRQAFGKSLLHNQYIQYKLGELATEVQLLRSLIYRVTGLYAKGEEVNLLASMAKLKAGRLAREVADGCLQFWGGMGYTSETLISRLFRDLRLLSIGGGADEVMLSVITRLADLVPPTKNR